MKYLIKLKKRHFKKLTKVLPKKRNQIDRKELILKKAPKKTEKKSRAYTPFDSPYNSNEYLIKNRSSPFFDDDDEEKDQFPCQPLELIGIDDEIIILDLFLFFLVLLFVLLLVLLLLVLFNKLLKLYLK